MGALLCGFVPSAHAHDTGGTPRVARIVATAPALPRDVVVQVQRSITDQLVAQNDTDEVLEVLGADGRAFLRIGRDGVEGDFGSRDYAQSTSPFGTVEGPADNTGAPRWTRISSGNAWGWFDHRLHPAVASDGFVPESLSWRIRLRLAGRATTVRGVTEAVRPQGAYSARLTVPHPRVGMVSGAIPLFTLSAEGPVITVFGRVGEPMLRAGDGSVAVNDASPTWALTLASRGEQPNGLVGPRETPRWRVLDDAVASWLDDRAALPLRAPSDPSRARTTKRWSIAIDTNGARSQLRGDIRWAPLAAVADNDSNPLDSLAVRIGVVAGVAALVLFVRRVRMVQ